MPGFSVEGREVREGEAASHLDVVVLGAGDDADVSVGGVRVVDGEYHHCRLVAARQLTHRLEAAARQQRTRYSGRRATSMSQKIIMPFWNLITLFWKIITLFWKMMITLFLTR